MPRSRDEAETMADATGLTGVAREAFIGRLTGGAPPAAPEPAPATPKATVQRSAPTTKPAPRSALLVTPPAPKPATPVAAAPPKPAVRPAYQMEEQVIVGTRPAQAPPQAPYQMEEQVIVGKRPQTAAMEKPPSFLGSMLQDAQLADHPVRTVASPEPPKPAGPVASAFQSLDTNAQAARTLFRQTGATDDDIYKVYLAPGGKGSAAMVQDAELVRTGKIKATK